MSNTRPLLTNQSREIIDCCICDGENLERGGHEEARYHGSWTHQREKAGSQQSGRNACQMEYNRAKLHTPVLPVRIAAELVEAERGVGGGFDS